MPEQRRLSRVEFIALLAMLFATIAFSIDSMLPALPEIGAEVSADNVNRAQLILTSFVLGLGIGTFFTGPFSDAFGRKPVMLIGATVYILAAIAGYFAQGLELILIARVLQGIGAAAPRVVGLALVRDLYAGRDMARIISFAMMIFTLVPAVAPLLGAGIIALFGWREIFLSFVIFALFSASWLAIRQPETLAPENRRPIRAALLWEAITEMAAHPTVRLSILAQTFSFAILFSAISLIHPIFDVVFHRAESFPLWFAGLAVFSAGGSFLNAALVDRLGMRKIASVALMTQVNFSVIMSGIWIFGQNGDAMFYVFVLWVTSIFFQTGLIMGNLNSIMMEPMGHIAGTAASVAGGLSTVLSAAIAAPIGLAFNGTPLPLTTGAACAAFAAWICMLIMQKQEQQDG